MVQAIKCGIPAIKQIRRCPNTFFVKSGIGLFFNDEMRMKRIITFLFIAVFCGGTALAQDAAAMIEYVESIPVETALDNPDIRNTQEVWIEMFSKAQKSIDLEQFYISPQRGEALDPVIEALIAAGQRGVEIRIIADRRMYNTYPAMLDSFSCMERISVRLIDFVALAGSVQHGKYMVVDGQILFIGSQNFDWRALTHIHELGLRINDKRVASVYQDLFDLDWRLAALHDPDSSRFVLSRRSYDVPVVMNTENYGAVTIQPTCSPRALIPDTTLWDEIHIARLLAQARKDICLQFLSYSPRSRDGSYYDALDGALRRAAGRGVKVRLLVSDWQKSSRAEAALKELAALENIEVKFSVIPEWSGGYIPYARVEHCKYILVDEAAFWLGTSNGEKSYLHTSRNAGLVIRNAAMAERLREIFYKSWDSSYTEEVVPSRFYAPREHTGE